MVAILCCIQVIVLQVAVSRLIATLMLTWMAQMQRIAGFLDSKLSTLARRQLLVRLSCRIAMAIEELVFNRARHILSSVEFD